MRVLITGVSSEIGLGLSRRLMEQGIQVVGFDIATPPAPMPGFTYVQGDVRNLEEVADAASGCDCGIHLASLAGNSAASEILHVNVTGAYSFLAAARTCRFRNAIIAGSVPVHLPVGAIANAELPTSAGDDHVYDLSKNLQERIAADFHNHGSPVMCLRFGHVVRGERAENLDDGTALAEFDYCRGGWVALEDVIWACAAALTLVPDEDALECLNLVGSRAARDRFAVEAAQRRLNLSLKYDFAEYE